MNDNDSNDSSGDDMTKTIEFWSVDSRGDVASLRDALTFRGSPLVSAPGAGLAVSSPPT